MTAPSVDYGVSYSYQSSLALLTWTIAPTSRWRRISLSTPPSFLIRPLTLTEFAQKEWYCTWRPLGMISSDATLLLLPSQSSWEGLFVQIWIHWCLTKLKFQGSLRPGIQEAPYRVRKGGLELVISMYLDCAFVFGFSSYPHPFSSFSSFFPRLIFVRRFLFALLFWVRNWISCWAYALCFGLLHIPPLYSRLLFAF